MWPLPRLRHELVTITLTPDSLACGWITRSSTSLFFKHKSPHAVSHIPAYVFRAYTYVPLENLECAQGIIYNPTRIAQHITHFLQVHRLHNAFIACAVSGDHVLQRLISLPLASPNTEQFTLPELEHKRWKYRYLYPNPDGTFTFYVCGLGQEQLFQYKLFAITAKLNLISIMPSWAAHLQAYKHLHGDAFSHSVLAADMHRTKMIEQLITPEQLKKTCTLPPPDIPTHHNPHITTNTRSESTHDQDTPLQACMLGLFIAGNSL